MTEFEDDNATVASDSVTTVTKNDPLFKAYRDDDAPLLSTANIVKVVVYGLCIALIILGTMFNIVLVSIIGMSAFILFTVALVLLAIQGKKARNDYNDKYIEAELNSFEDDLVHTLYAYDVKYSEQDVDEAVNRYRSVLEREVASISDLDENDLNAMMSVIKQPFTEKAAERKKAKSQRES